MPVRATQPFFVNRDRSYVHAEEKPICQYKGADDRPSYYCLTHRSNVVSVKIPSDGQSIVALLEDGTAAVWGTQIPRQQMGPISNETHKIISIEFSQDGKQFVAVLEDGTVSIFDFASREPVQTLHGVGIRSAKFSTDGKRMVTISEAHADTWDLTSGSHLLTFPFDCYVTSAEFSPDGKEIVVGLESGMACVLGSNFCKVTAFFLHGGRVNSAQFSSDGKRVITASDDGLAAAWSPYSKNNIVVYAHNLPVHSANFSPNRDRMLTASQDKGAAVVSIEPCSVEVQYYLGHGEAVLSAQFFPDGRQVATASGKKVYLWSV